VLHSRAREQHSLARSVLCLIGAELHPPPLGAAVAEEGLVGMTRAAKSSLVLCAHSDRSAARTVLQDEDQEEDSSDDSSSAKHIGTSSRVHHVRLTTVTRSNPVKSNPKSMQCTRAILSRVVLVPSHSAECCGAQTSKLSASLS
jgi:hypothetical protein